MLMKAGKQEAGMTRTSRVRTILVTAGVVVALVALSAGVWAMWRAHSRDKLLAALKDDPRKLRQAVEDGQISREDARETMADASEARMNKTMDDYFALPAGKERDKYLDKMIDEQEAMRRRWQQRAATQPSTRPARDRDERPTSRPAGDWQQRRAERADRTPPERQAKRAEFTRAMMQRRTERGLPTGGGPGGGGWRGGGGGGRGR